MSMLPPSQRFKHLWPKADREAALLLQSISTDKIQNPRLELALDACVSARSLIAPEQAKIDELIATTIDPVTLAARHYQRDLISWQLTRAADLATERLNYLNAIRDFKTENAKCASDIHHWFRYYAWGFDPRPDAPLAIMPLVPFEFQTRFIDWLNQLVFTLRTSGVAEKSRDMGATVFALAWSIYHWRYTPHFSVMLASATEDLVDSKKDSDTLFEKERFLLRYLPGWMLPTGFNLDRDTPYMNIANPVEGGLITGSAPTAKVGRQRRRTAVICDEFSAWPFGGFPQHQAMTQTAKSIIAIGTPEGRFNKYADLAHDGVTERFEMDWREHEWKDERWYNSLQFGVLCPAMTNEDIAQEIDRNYDASQPGRVLKNVREEYCFITVDEMIKGFGSRGSLFRTNDGRFRLPSDWNWGRVTDYGESAQREDDTHIWAYSLFARPAERWPLSDSLFFFISAPIMPIGATELEGFACYSEWERQLGLRGENGFLREPSVNDMSHEALDPKQVLRDKCGDNWRIPDLDFDKGRRKLVFHFELTDKHKPNPFRDSLMGRARIYFVSLSNEYQLARNERSGAHFVTPSTTQQGFKRLRAEIPAWHYPPEERGKPVPKMRPQSVFDDIITTVRYAVARWGMDAGKLSYKEQVNEHVPERYRPEVIVAAQSTPLTPEQELSYQFQLARAKKIVGQTGIVEFDDRLQRVGSDDDSDEWG